MDVFSGSQKPLYEVKVNLFKGLSHPVRIRVLEVLAERSDVSVTALLIDTGLEASHLSQHLSVLRRYHLVTAERRSNQVFYSLTYPEVANLLTVARSLLVKLLETTQDQLSSTLTPPPSDGMRTTPLPTRPTSPGAGR